MPLLVRKEPIWIWEQDTLFARLLIHFPRIQFSECLPALRRKYIAMWQQITHKRKASQTYPFPASCQPNLDPLALCFWNQWSKARRQSARAAKQNAQISLFSVGSNEIHPRRKCKRPLSATSIKKIHPRIGSIWKLHRLVCGLRGQKTRSAVHDRETDKHESFLSLSLVQSVLLSAAQLSAVAWNLTARSFIDSRCQAQ